MADPNIPPPPPGFTIDTTPASGPIYGPPLHPTPQTPDQAAGQALQNTHEQQQIQAQPLQNASTQANINQSNASIHNQTFNRNQGLRQEFNNLPEVKNYGVALSSLGTALKAPNTPQGDLAIIYAYAKAADPGSVVREGEMDMATATASLPEQFQADAQKLTQGKRLPPQVRTGLIEAMRQSVLGMRQTYDLQRNRYAALAQQNGFDPQQIVGQPLYDAIRPLEENYIRQHGETPRDPYAPGTTQPPQTGDIGAVTAMQRTPPSPMSREQQAAFDSWIRANPNATPDQLVSFVHSIGLPGISNPEDYLKALKQGSALPAASAIFGKPDITDVRGGNNTNTQDTINAAARGVGDTLSLGALDKAVALGDTVFKGGTFDQNLNRQYAISDYDQQNHPFARLGGEALGGAVLPMGDVSNLANLSLKGAGYGAAYGLGSSRQLSDIPANMIGGAVAGAAVPAVLGKVFHPHAGGVDPLVDPVTGELNQPMVDSMNPAQRAAVMQAYGMKTLTPGMVGGRTARVLEQGLNNVPGSAGVMEDVNSAASAELRRSMQGVAQQFGQSKTLAEGGTELQRGANEFINRSQAVTAKAYNAIPIADNAHASTTNTVGILRELTGRFQSNPDLAEVLKDPKLERYFNALTQPTVKQIDPRQAEITRNLYKNMTGEELPPGYVPDPSEMLGAARSSLRDRGGMSLNDVGPTADRVPRQLSWKDLKDFRSIIGEKIGEMRFGETSSTSDLRALYAGLSRDMQDTAAAQGPRAVAAFNRANALYRQQQQLIQGALTRILGPDGNMTPERSAAAVQAMTKGGKAGGDIKTLAQIKGATAKSGAWDEIASTLIHLGGQPANSEGRAFSPQTFVQWYADMSEPARQLLFKPELRKSLDGFVAMNQQLSRLKGLTNTSNTTPTMIGSAAITAGGLEAVSHPMALLGILGGGAANYGMAKLWTSPAFVRLMTGLGRSVASGSQHAVQSQVGRLAKFAAANPEFSEPVQAILRQVSNDNFVGPLAASPDANQKQQQK